MNPCPAPAADRVPFPGLRPFEMDEAEFFFGRGRQIDHMLRKLERQRFLAVIGASGSGKSSLVRAGLLPAVRDGFLAGADDEWRMFIMRPGDAPFARLAEALVGARLDDPSALLFAQQTLRCSDRGLVRALHDVGVPDATHVLVVVDQFEELFRYRRHTAGASPGDASRSYTEQHAAASFINLLLASAAQTERPVHVVLTMRSEKLGECDAFPGLPEAINAGQFLVPRLEREQMRTAIEGPLHALGAEAEPALVQRLLNDADAEFDQLPLLQHALLRLWLQAGARSEKPVRLRLADYEALGGIGNILSNHAQEAYNQLADDRERRLAEKLFRSLAEQDAAGNWLRRWGRLRELASEIGAPWQELARVAQTFVGQHRNFLMAAPAALLGPESTLDISHEALLRRWRLLHEWTRQEADSAARYRRLLDTARRWEKKEAGLWGAPDLDVAVRWRNQEQPTVLWAERYGGGWELTQKFLDESEKERQRRQDERRRDRLVRRSWQIATGLAALAVVGIVVYDFYKSKFARFKQDTERSAFLNASGERQLQDGDIAGALLHFANAAAGDESIRNLRLGIGVRQFPKLAKLWLYAEQIPAGVVASPDGRWLIYGKTVPAKGQTEQGLLKIVGDDQPEVAAAIPVAPIVAAAFHPNAKNLPYSGEIKNIVLLTAEEFEENNTKKTRFRQWRVGPKLEPRGEPLLLTGKNASVVFHPRENHAVLTTHCRAIVVDLEAFRENPGPPLHAGAELSQALYSDDGRWLLLVAAKAKQVIPFLIGAPDTQASLPSRYRQLQPSKLPKELNHVAMGPMKDKQYPVVIATGEQGDGEGEASLWHCTEEEGLKRIRTLLHPSGVTFAEFNPNGHMLVTACHDGYARLWGMPIQAQLGSQVDVPAGFPNARLPDMPLQAPAVEAGPLCTQKADFELKHGSSVMCAAFSPDGRLVATGGRDKTTRIWSVRTGAPVFPALNHYKTVGWVGFAPNGFRLATLGGAMVQLWELFTANPTPRTLVWPGDFHDVTLSLDARWAYGDGEGRQLVSAALTTPQGRIVMWEPQKTGATKVLPPRWHGLAAAPHPRNSNYVAVVVRDTQAALKPKSPAPPMAALWNLATDQLAPLPDLLLDPGFVVRAVRWNPEGTQLVVAGADSAGKGALHLLRFTLRDEIPVSTGETLTLGEGHAEAILDAGFDARSGRLVTAGVDDQALVWDLPAPGTGPQLVPRPVLPPCKHSADVVRASFDKSGAYLVTASYDGTAAIWEVGPGKSGTRLGALEHDAAVSDAFFLRLPQFEQELFVATACRDGMIRLWHLQPAKDMQAHLIAVFETSGHVRQVCHLGEARRLAAISSTGTANPSCPEAAAPPKSETGTPVLMSFHAWHLDPEKVELGEIETIAARTFQSGSLGPVDVKQLNATWSQFEKDIHARFHEKQKNEQKRKSQLLHQHALLASESKQLQDWHAAGWHWQRMLLQDPDPTNVHRQTGLLKDSVHADLKLQRPQTALERLTDAGTWRPALALAQNRAVAALFGEVYVELERWEQAVQAYQASSQKDFWKKERSRRRLDALTPAYAKLNLHDELIELLNWRRAEKLGDERLLLTELARVHAAHGEWRALRDLVQQDYLDKSLYQSSAIADFMIQRYFVLACFELGEVKGLTRVAAILDSSFGAKRLSQPELRLLGASTLASKSAGEEHARFTAKMLATFKQQPGAPAALVPNISAALAWTCCVGPLPPIGAEGAEIPLRLAQDAVGKEPTNADYSMIRAVAQIRRGLWEQEPQKRAALLRAGLEQLAMPPASWQGCAGLLRAMAYAALQQDQQARLSLKEAEAWGRKEFDAKRLDPAAIDRLADFCEFQVLRAEAARRVGLP